MVGVVGVTGWRKGREWMNKCEAWSDVCAESSRNCMGVVVGGGVCGQVMNLPE